PGVTRDRGRAVVLVLARVARGDAAGGPADAPAGLVVEVAGHLGAVAQDRGRLAVEAAHERPGRARLLQRRDVAGRVVGELPAAGAGEDGVGPGAAHRAPRLAVGLRLALHQREVADRVVAVAGRHAVVGGARELVDLVVGVDIVVDLL